MNCIQCDVCKQVQPDVKSDDELKSIKWSIILRRGHRSFSIHVCSRECEVRFWQDEFVLVPKALPPGMKEFRCAKRGIDGEMCGREPKIWYHGLKMNAVYARCGSHGPDDEWPHNKLVSFEEALVILVMGS